MTTVFERSQCFLKRVIKKITIFASEINSNRLEDHIAYLRKISRKRLSYKGRRANALALRADEGRG